MIDPPWIGYFTYMVSIEGCKATPYPQYFDFYIWLEVET